MSLVLDEMGEISLTLEKMEAKKLDEYISKNFSSSEDIRKKYAAKINPYLEQRKAFITKVEIYNDKRYSGSIVITELQNDLTIKKKKVLYKKHMIIFREITKNKKFILALENRDYINYQASLKNNQPYSRIFSEAYGKEIRFRCTSDSKFNRTMGSWRNVIKDLNRYYDIVRTVLKEYKNRYKDLGLDSPDVVYSKYMESKAEKKENSLNTDKQLEIETIEQDNQVRYKSGADEEGYPGDLERLDNSQYKVGDTDTDMSINKTKRLNNGHHRLFGFDN